MTSQRAIRPALFDRLPGRPIAAVLAAAGVLAAVLVGRGGLDTVVGCGIPQDEFASQTASDWVTNADHVVVATPTGEKETGREDFTEGSLKYAADRDVTFRAEKVLWSAGAPRHALGDGFDLVAPGWRVYQSGTRVKRTAAAAPRLETGHTYLLALRWVDGAWKVLGEGAAVPFDDHVAGRGEWCGRVLGEGDVALGERFSREDDSSLEEDVWGRNEEAVSAALRSAKKS
ncbi:hypothetical protein [Streptomyces daghestanicus]|jgi:hypothetical protein|uniref:Integral membrane protein n=1 Tax=Streptomyces daghestanicus TaxID=66885 RepID=A0ABQ3QA34_9ACTN|nr:hypothetical protein [Streptomyces daghestanicus]GGU36246.1 hypothetical protein GCM10010259_28570 [Streptomyces daghestanicus]GHI34125.1 hypothetical protein Sdagh_58550 [Streptomyces daghestanicus]